MNEKLYQDILKTHQKAIMLSVKKKYIDLILDEKKTIEVRKTFPGLDKIDKYFINRALPRAMGLFEYDAYLYECGVTGSHKVKCSLKINGFLTVNKDELIAGEVLEEILKNNKDSYFKDESELDLSLLDEIYLLDDQEIYFNKKGKEKYEDTLKSKFSDESKMPNLKKAFNAITFKKKSCLTYDELLDYLGDKPCLYGYKLYKVKELDLPLSDFYLEKDKKCVRPPQSFYYVLKPEIKD